MELRTSESKFLHKLIIENSLQHYFAFFITQFLEREKWFNIFGIKRTWTLCLRCDLFQISTTTIAWFQLTVYFTLFTSPCQLLCVFLRSIHLQTSCQKRSNIHWKGQDYLQSILQSLHIWSSSEHMINHILDSFSIRNRRRRRDSIRKRRLC